ncbi:sensor domain-containing diguanylate cyclase [Caldibacillus lycopersici]|uniref:Sensor domain-containing diguanylate cyclase n=1 Tax=Perspicuibacillus lycopersici TaxID=1325689 RepID=A0AAE3IWN0_9BACI|nr:sensor domain-containing diguanylate cyclase [Perspicuibacillus lycopersici]MCU9613425.1 sensor domain-containing diguanylate cyclase [Perspicuibacillus lycopersici]
MDQTVANKLSHGLYMIQNGKFLWVNESFGKIFGYSSDEIKKKNYEEMIDPDVCSTLSQFISKTNSGEMEQFEIEGKGIKRDGCLIDISLSNRRIVFDGKPTSIGSVIDISDRKKLEGKLKESQERYRNLVENSLVGIMIHENETFKYANPMALNLLGAENTAEVIGQPIDRFVHSKFKSIVSKRIENIVRDGKSVPPMYQKMIRIDGTEIDVEISGIPIQLGDISAVEIMFWDVTDKKKEEELVRYRAYYDTLTDLPNYNKFQQDYADEFNEDQYFTLLYLDMDGLKEINEYYGRQAGDMVMVKVAARLSGIIGNDGLIYRMNGDEFAIVLQGHKTDSELRSIGEKIKNITQLPIYTSNTTVRVSVTMGVVYYPNDGVEMEMLLRHADMAKNHALKEQAIYKIYDY